MTPSRGSEVGIGDAVRAFGRLQPDDPARVARLLGFDLRPHRTIDERGIGPVATRGATIPEVGRHAADRTTLPDAETPEPVTASAANRAPAWRRYLTPLRRDALRQPDDTTEVTALPAETTGRPPMLDFLPLLRPTVAPRLVEAMVSSSFSDGDLDIDAVVEALALRQHLTALPMQPRESLRRGVQVLLDRAAAMAPFHRDSDELVHKIQALVGTTMVQRLHFKGNPIKAAGRGAARTWKPYQPPDPGTPVLAVTELGMSNVTGRLTRDLQDSWLELQALLEHRRSRLVVLVPFGPRRWPARLAHGLDLVSWDRSTTTSSLHRELASRRTSPGIRR